MSNVVVKTKPLNDISDDWNHRRRYSRTISAPAPPTQEETERNWAALLPSKYAFATVRVRNMDDKQKFYNTVRGVMSIRGLRGNMNVDFPDVGNVEDEPHLEIEDIKELPVSMAEKRELCAKHQQRGESHTATRQKYRSKRFMYRMRRKWSETISKVQIWQKDMKKIEGNYGTGVVSYFVFIKWLTLLNLFNFILIFGFIMIPRLLNQDNVTNNEGTWEVCCSRAINDTNACNAQYISNKTSSDLPFIEVVQGIVQGTGIMEYTAFFYGYYSYQTSSTVLQYNDSIGYVFTILVVLLVSLFVTIREASKGITYKFHEGEEKFYNYCNLVWGGWDFCIDNEKAAHMKKVLISNEIRASLEEERLLEERRCRSKLDKIKLVIIRVVLNVVQVSILFCCGCVIFFVFRLSTKKVQQMNEKKGTEVEGFEKFIYEFLPSIAIVCINIIVPIIFKFIINYERYSPNFTITILLIRTVFLRMASIIVFYASVYTKIPTYGTGYDSNCSLCWETFVGQQIYRLALTDFATHILLTFFVNFPRSFIAEKFGSIKVISFLCEQTFDLPKHVLDVIYTQMLCWLGAFYAPLLPGMFVIIFFLLFYIKKFACLVNSKPGAIIHRTSRSKFMYILLIAYVVAVFPVLYTIGEIEPSTSCGPFRHYDNIWESVTKAFSDIDILRDIAEFIITTYVGIILFIVLILCISFYVATKNANEHMAKLLKTQLLLEGHDKRFLLEKLSTCMRQQRQTDRRAL